MEARLSHAGYYNLASSLHKLLSPLNCVTNIQEGDFLLFVPLQILLIQSIGKSKKVGRFRGECVRCRLQDSRVDCDEEDSRLQKN